jgi:hypothetical protein
MTLETFATQQPASTDGLAQPDRPAVRGSEPLS